MSYQVGERGVQSMCLSSAFGQGENPEAGGSKLLRFLHRAIGGTIGDQEHREHFRGIVGTQQVPDSCSNTVLFIVRDEDDGDAWGGLSVQARFEMRQCPGEQADEIAVADECEE